MKRDEGLVVAYWHDYVTRHVQHDAEEADRWFWAWEAVDALVREDPDAAVHLCVALAEYCCSSQGLAALGAGPVEDLVRAADDTRMAKILKLAIESARFRRALATIWIRDLPKAKMLRRFFREHRPELPDGVLDDAVGP